MKKTRLRYSDRALFCKNILAQQIFLLLENKQTNLALSADVINCDALLLLADLIGPEICILKTHVDILDDFTPSFAEELKRLANKHQFFIFEDRKFADIGHTVKKQYSGGVYRIADWADLINAHPLPGPGIVSGLAEIGTAKQRGLLLLAEMSSDKNLITSTYTQKTVEMAEIFQEFVVGFVAQRKLSPEPQWLYLTPGVQIQKEKDTLGQRYVTPELAILEHESDIIIVGRGILDSHDPLIEAKKYREAGWKAYEASI
jgi:uridine monophosphate synthetase